MTVSDSRAETEPLLEPDLWVFHGAASLPRAAKSVLAELTFRLFHLPDMVESYLREIEPPRQPGAKGPSRRAVRRAAAGRNRRPA